MNWYKQYAEFASDPKVQSMSEPMQRRLVMLFCLQCSGDLPKLDREEICLALRIPEKELEKTHALFLKKGFIEDDFSIRNWRKRQAPSDPTAAERMARMRARHTQDDRNVTRNVTPPVTGVTDSLRVEAELEQETEGEEESAAALPAREGDPPEPRYPEPDGLFMIMPGPHRMPDETARALWSLIWQGWGSESICVGFYQHQRFYKADSWREAIREVASRRVGPNSIGYFEAIAADRDANGIPEHKPKIGTSRAAPAGRRAPNDVSAERKAEIIRELKERTAARELRLG